MNARNLLLVKGGILILVLWGVVGLVVKVAGGMTPSPEKIEALVKENPLENVKDPEKRKKIIGRIAKMMNQLDGEDLRELEEKTDRETRRAMFSTMSQEEQWYFMEQRMGRAFTQMMQVFNKMDREERKKLVSKALGDMKKNGARRPGGQEGPSIEEADPEMVEKVANAGLEAYFRDASAETKMDLAPLMEEVQKIMSSPDRGPHRRRKK